MLREQRLLSHVYPFWGVNRQLCTDFWHRHHKYLALFVSDNQVVGVNPFNRFALFSVLNGDATRLALREEFVALRGAFEQSNRRLRGLAEHRQDALVERHRSSGDPAPKSRCESISVSIFTRSVCSVI